MSRTISGPPDRATDLSIVVPFYNPGSRLRPTLESLVDTLTGIGRPYEIIAVSDGSTDGSETSIAHLDQKALRIIDLGRNYGKGEALRVGMGMATGIFVGFIDSDGDIMPSVIAEFFEIMVRTNADAVLGSKHHPDSNVTSPLFRKVLSTVWQLLVRVLFRLPVTDSQTGVKLFRREVIAAVLPYTKMLGFSFDLEFLVVAHDLGYTNVIVAPVDIAGKVLTTVSFRSSLHMVSDLLRIFHDRWSRRGLTGQMTARPLRIGPPIAQSGQAAPYGTERSEFD